MVTGATSSPDGQHILVTKIVRPYSYLLTSSSFPKQIDVIGLDGKQKYHVADIPLEENIPIEGVRIGRRAIQWRASHPATLIWTEALDEGDPRRKVPHRDQLKSLSAPFSSEPTNLVQLEHRYAGVGFFANPNLLMTTENDRDRRWVRSLLHDTSALDVPPKILVDRSSRDRYGDPGRMLTKPDAAGFPIAQQSDSWVWLAYLSWTERTWIRLRQSDYGDARAVCLRAWSRCCPMPPGPSPISLRVANPPRNHRTTSFAIWLATRNSD
jgi:hypothetical protein